MEHYGNSTYNKITDELEAGAEVMQRKHGWKLEKLFQRLQYTFHTKIYDVPY
jgi:hypothetical protein